MIRLTEIKRDNGKISCNAFVEDCKIAVPLLLDEKTGELSSYHLPSDYEWCISHITHASKYLRSLNGKPIESDTHTIMWY